MLDVFCLERLAFYLVVLFRTEEYGLLAQTVTGNWATATGTTSQRPDRSSNSLGAEFLESPAEGRKVNGVPSLKIKNIWSSNVDCIVPIFVCPSKI